MLSHDMRRFVKVLYKLGEAVNNTRSLSRAHTYKISQTVHVGCKRKNELVKI